MQIYCGNNHHSHELQNGAQIGTRHLCLRKGIGRGRLLDLDNFTGQYAPIDERKIYCGNSDQLPDGYDIMGSNAMCLQKGVGVGMMQQFQEYGHRRRYRLFKRKYLLGACIIGTAILAGVIIYFTMTNQELNRVEASVQSVTCTGNICNATVIYQIKNQHYTKDIVTALGVNTGDVITLVYKDGQPENVLLCCQKNNDNLIKILSIALGALIIISTVLYIYC